MKKFFKIFFVTGLVVFTLFFCAAGVFLLTPTNMQLDENLLINTSDFACFYDTHNSIVETDSEFLGVLDELPADLKNVIISAEDKNFYSHNGIDYLRIIKSAAVNIKNGNFSQGASTISQQLIKNTHLTQEKTLSRKLKEIKLAQKLEENYEKDQILNMYLNTVYFGQNVYGVKNAAKYYFSKELNELDVCDCAALAGMIPSPAKYNPVVNKDLCLQKRNEVLKRTFKNGYMTEDEYNAAISKELDLNIKSSGSPAAPYLDAACEEIYENTALTPYDLNKLNIYTYYDEAVQNICKGAKTEDDKDFQSIVIDNRTRAVKAYYSTCGTILRSPASTIKPLAVYAPALDTGLVYEMTKIKDEKTVIDGWSPSNYKDKYYGEVSLKFALANSLNAPAATLYNSIGKEKCIEYLKNLGITDSNDNPDISLGRMNEGITLKQLAQAYCVFSNSGVFKSARFVKKITDKTGKVIYSEPDDERAVFSEGTATLINDMLKECVKTGTAKKLNGKNYELCAKTGTNGNENGNTDAYVSAYTAKDTICCWCGYADSSYMDNSVTGGSAPCVSASYILDNLYQNNAPANFKIAGITEIKIDKESYDKKGEFLIATKNAPEKDTCKFLFDIRFQPTKQKTPDVPDIDDVKIKFDKNGLSFVYDKDLSALIEIDGTFGKETIFDGKLKDFYDFSGHKTFYITPYVSDGKEKIYGKTVTKTADYTRKEKSAVIDEWWLD